MATLFSATRQMSAIARGTAIEQGLPYRVVSEVNVMSGDGHREKSNRLFFLEIMPYRCGVPWKAPEPYLVAAYRVKEVVPAAAAAPELPLLRERFGVRPNLTMGDLAQKVGPIELVIARDYRRYWPRLSDSSCFAGDDLHLMKTVSIQDSCYLERPNWKLELEQHHEERSQEEAHPGDGEVSRILDIIVQAITGGSTGGGFTGEAAA